MYRPSKIERDNCTRIVKDILKLECEPECEEYVDEILKITYSIGGDYSKKTLTAVAEALLKK